MSFVDAIAVLRRHKLLLVYGLLLAVLAATFSAYRLDGTDLVSRTAPAYETTAVVAVRPGAEQPTTTVATTPPAPTTVVAVDPNASPASTVPPTTVATPPLAPLSAVVDTRAMYYTALSLKTVVVSPGFEEAVQARAPEMDGSITAVVAQDTNTMDVVVDGSTPAIATATMTAALAELQTVMATYSATPATRFALDGVVISAPSAPASSTGIKDSLTFVLVLVVAIALWWFLIRAIDAVQLSRRRAVPPADRQRPAPAAPAPRTAVPPTVPASDDALPAPIPAPTRATTAPEPARNGNGDGHDIEPTPSRPSAPPADVQEAPAGMPVGPNVPGEPNRPIVRPSKRTGAPASRSARRGKQGSARVR